MIPVLGKDPASPFPPTDQVLEDPAGLLAMGGDLSPTRLINAYQHGIFPWFSDDQPILWWSPVPRCVLYPRDVHISRRLRRHYNQGKFNLTADRAFDDVIRACAAPREGQDGTWITRDMQNAYICLHRLGIAHSVEVWDRDRLVGGIYGLALGQVFFGESMFSKHTDASKVALVALCKQLQRWDFNLLDCQISNPHLVSMGATQLSLKELHVYLQTSNGTDHWGQDFDSVARW